MTSVLTLACRWGFLDNTTTCEPRGTSETKPGKVRNTDISSLPACLPPARLKSAQLRRRKGRPMPVSAPNVMEDLPPRPHPGIAHPFQISLSYDDCRNCTHNSYKKLATDTKGLQLQLRRLHTHRRPPATHCHKPCTPTCNSALPCPTGFKQHPHALSPDRT